jgi:hypothetical protein
MNFLKTYTDKLTTLKMRTIFIAKGINPFAKGSLPVVINIIPFAGKIIPFKINSIPFTGSKNLPAKGRNPFKKGRLPIEKGRLPFANKIVPVATGGGINKGHLVNLF